MDTESNSDSEVDFHPPIEADEPLLEADEVGYAPDLSPEHTPFPSDLIGGKQYGRAVRHVTGGGPIAFGEAVQFEFEFADGTREKFHAVSDEFPRIVSDLKGFAGIAERARRGGIGFAAEVINPYQATDARTDRVGPMVVVRFPTTYGIPLLIAMESSVAEKLLLGLDRELSQPRR